MSFASTKVLDDLRKVDAGSGEPQDVAFVPLEVVRESVRACVAAARDKGVSLLVRVLDEPPPRVHGDSERLRQVLTSLVAHAVRFTDERSLTVEVAWAPGGGANGRLEVGIRDTSIGIVPDERAQLGSMGGEVAVRSQPGEGATFHIAVPFERARDAIDPEQEALDAAMRLEQGSYRVLLVEDDRLNQMVAGAMLRRVGIEVETASDGRQALELLERERFDLVLMDVQMPVMDGHATTRRLRETERVLGLRHTPVMAMTGNTGLEDRDACRAAGMDDVVPKPFEASVLHTVLARWLVPSEG